MRLAELQVAAAAMEDEPHDEGAKKKSTAPKHTLLSDSDDQSDMDLEKKLRPHSRC